MSETAPSGASSQTPPTAEISVGTDTAYAEANAQLPFGNLVADLSI